MGLLDDAIREHLDLKRRRGADPSEIAREEAEALGPVRREAPSEDEAALTELESSYTDHEPAALDEPAVVYDDEPAVIYDDEPGAVGLSRYDEEPEEPQPAPREPEPPSDRPEPAEPPSTHDAPYPEREDESATPPHGDPLMHQQTREFSATELGEAMGHDTAPDADVVPADDEDAEAEDELEETPDFLQETPEHDRLWFEQKPPKDFDF